MLDLAMWHTTLLEASCLDLCVQPGCTIEAQSGPDYDLLPLQKAQTKTFTCNKPWANCSLAADCTPDCKGMMSGSQDPPGVGIGAHQDTEDLFASPELHGLQDCGPRQINVLVGIAHVRTQLGEVTPAVKPVLCCQQKC